MDVDEKLKELRQRQDNLKRLQREAAKVSGNGAGRYRADAAARSREKSATRQEIGPLPAVKDIGRQRAALESFQAYCEIYHAPTFYLPWSADHRKAISRIQECVVDGGLSAIAMMRGGGKTALSRRSVEWGVLKGVRHFGMLLGATDVLSVRNMRSIKRTFSGNQLLLEDFPEICYPIWRLENEPRRCQGQTYKGRRTQILWSEDEIRLPDIEGLEGLPTAWATLWCKGITAAFRGANVPAPDGGEWRPDFVLPDDVQTRESAKSPVQTHDLELIINGDVLELAGPDKKVAAVMPCTVIYPNDLSERFLDRNRHPEWRGEKFKAIYAFPEAEVEWRQYAELRGESLRTGGNGSEATAYYSDRREIMDRGAVVGWPERKKDDEISGLQSAMNVRIDKPETFAAEWQNEPQLPQMQADVRQLEEKDLAAKLNQLQRGTVPRECNTVTAFIDVQGEVLLWKVWAFTAKFGGACIDYGAFPQQPSTMFSGKSPDCKLSHIFPHKERGARIYAGLASLVPQLFGRSFRQDGTNGSFTISLCLIDAGFENKTVHEFISRSPLRALLKPSMGKGVGPANKPMNDYRREPGDLMGWNWRIDAHVPGAGRFVSFDSNAWKSYCVEALLAPAGSLGAFYLFGSDLQRQHPLLTQHLLSEYRVPTFGQGRQVEVWKLRPDSAGENHFLDGMVGCAVAASVSGLKYSAAAAIGEPPLNAPKRPRPSFSERQRLKREARMG